MVKKQLMIAALVTVTTLGVQANPPAGRLSRAATAVKGFVTTKKVVVGAALTGAAATGYYFRDAIATKFTALKKAYCPKYAKNTVKPAAPSKALVKPVAAPVQAQPAPTTLLGASSAAANGPVVTSAAPVATPAAPQSLAPAPAAKPAAAPTPAKPAKKSFWQLFGN